MIWNIPNILTLTRVALVPLAAGFHACGMSLVAVLLAILGAVTDFFDGYLARRWNQTTDIGALLDPVADKLCVIGFFSYFLAFAMVAPWFGGLLIARSLAQLAAIPILVWWLKREFHVKPKWQPKWATALALGLVPWLLLDPGSRPQVVALGVQWVIVPASAVLEIYVLATYLPRLVQIAVGAHDTFE